MEIIKNVFKGKHTISGQIKDIELKRGDLVEIRQLRGHLCEIIYIDNCIIHCRSIALKQEYSVFINDIIVVLPKEDIK